MLRDEVITKPPVDIGRVINIFIESIKDKMRFLNRRTLEYEMKDYLKRYAISKTSLAILITESINDLLSGVYNPEGVTVNLFEDAAGGRRTRRRGRRGHKKRKTRRLTKKERNS